VIIKGTLETNEERVRLRATNIFSIRELRNGTRVRMRINDAITREDLLKLKDILKDYPGNSPIHLHITTDIGEAVIELGKFRVDIQDKLIDDLESHFGKGVLLFG